jgi:hypothetical protein
MKKPFPWPIVAMREWYEQDQMTLQEIADLLCSAEWRDYWIENLGKPYRPGQKIVNKVCKRAGFAMRKTGAVGNRNGNWIGGRIVDKAGYILVKCDGHPAANSGGYVREHRLIAERTLGRYLKPSEVVHHIDDDPANNDPANLMVYDTNAVHLAGTLKGQAPEWTPSGRKKIAAAIQKARVLNTGRKRPKHWKPSNTPLAWPVELMKKWFVEDGLSCKQIAQLLDRGSRTVTEILNQAGVPRRKKCRRVLPPITDAIRREAAQLEAKFRGNPKRGASRSL